MFMFLITSAWIQEYVQAKDMINAIEIFQVQVPTDLIQPDRKVISAKWLGELG